MKSLKTNRSVRIITILFALFLCVNFLSVNVLAEAEYRKRLYKQNDSSEWTSEYYQSGCILFSFANAIYCLNGKKVDVEELGTWAKSIGAWKPGDGGGIRGTFYKNVQSKFGSKYGFKITNQGTYSSVNNSALKNHLKNGGVAVGHVTNHFIAIVDYDSSADKFFVVDSYVTLARGLPAADWVSSEYLQSHTDATVDWFALISSSVPGQPTIKSWSANGMDSVTIKWGAVSGATSYTVKRRKKIPDATTEYEVVKTGLTETSFTDTGLETATMYYYKVVAVNSAGSSKASESMRVWTRSKAPKVEATGSTSVKITWDSVMFAATYRIDRRVAEEGTEYSTIKTGLTTTSYTDTGLSPDTPYYYRVYPVGGDDTDNITVRSETSAKVQTPAAGSEMTGGYDRVLPDGDYMIVSAADPRYFLDISGGDAAAANGSNVQIYGPNYSSLAAHDVWTITYSDGFYSICQKGSTAALDVNNGSTEAGTNVQAWGKNNSSAQKWAVSIIKWWEKGYRIQPKCSGMSLDIAGGNIASGTNVRQYTTNTSDAQRWLFIPHEPGRPVEDGRYMLISGMDPHVEMYVPGNTGDIADGTSIQIWSDGTNNRFNSFDVRYAGDGYYNLVHAASGKYAGVEGSSTENYADVQLSAPDGSNSQKWCMIEQNGGYILVNRHSGLVMDVDSGKTENATNVRQHFYNGANAQTWKFVKAEYTVSYEANGGTGAPPAQTKYYANALVLSPMVPTARNRIFKGWSARKDAAEAQYQPGGSYTADSDVVLYAVWEELEADLVLPEELKEIGEEAFEGGTFRCVRVGENVETIGSRAFADCGELRYMIIPERTAYIAPDAFVGTNGLTIIGESGSYAEQYAQEYGFDFIENDE